MDATARNRRTRRRIKKCNSLLTISSPVPPDGVFYLWYTSRLYHHRNTPVQPSTSVISAYLGVILIWSTTPLGIKWSGEEGISFLFGLTARMAIGCVLAIVAVMLLRIPMGLSRKSVTAYCASALGIYVAMLCAYWGVKYIPSGWVAVIWGTSSVFTGILAQRYLGEPLGLNRILGLLLSVGGLATIFLRSQEAGEQAWLGVLLVLGGVLGQSSTAVWLKWLDAKEHGLMMTASGLLLSLPFFALTWWIFDGQWPQQIPLRAGLSIVYLAVFGSLLGFSLYYFLINRIEASQVALITLVTPVTSLLIGHWLNHEPLSLTVYLGTGLILAGLASFQWGGRWLR